MAKRRRSPLPDFIATTLWMVPVMAVFALGGFMIGRDAIGRKYLTPTQVKDNRPRPIRILTPEEARALAEQPAPMLTPDSDPKDKREDGKRHRSRRSQRTAPSGEQTAAGTVPPTGATAPTLPAATGTPLPTPLPAAIPAETPNMPVAPDPSAEDMAVDVPQD